MAKVCRGTFDLAIIGGGIVGLATARRVALRHPKLKICLVEKDKELASHQSKRNSGVVHCGIYYKRGSLKSKFCIRGAQMVKEYCEAKNLPFKQCGKLIVATKRAELDTLHDLFANATANKIKDIEMITSKRVEEIQPGCTKAIEAIWSPNTAIVDWQKVALSYAQDFRQDGGTILTKFAASDILPQDNGSLIIECGNDIDFIETKSIVCCAGVYSDYFCRRTGNNEHPKVLPFKGNYHLLSDRLSKSIKTNIYPVPNPKVPFLGVHVTPRIDGSVLIGPTALLALSYENYNQDERRFRFIQAYHILIRSGFRKMLKNRDYLKAGLMEFWRYASPARVAKDVEEFLPGIREEDLVPTKFCGIRAQVVSRDGELVDDFLIESGLLQQYSRVLHIRNCPSPAATSSLALAERIVSTLENRFI